MSTPRLGQITPKQLREVWPNEATAFTPWLYENSDLLAATLGLSFTLNGREHGVGDFSLDLIGTNDATGGTVIIENQIEETDHRHLGQLMTYWAGTDAETVIWVASRFRPEHRRALEILNESTVKSVAFFGVEVTLISIDDSAPAPLFTVVAKPSDWERNAKRATSAARQDGNVAANQLRSTQYPRLIEFLRKQDGGLVTNWHVDDLYAEDWTGSYRGMSITGFDRVVERYIGVHPTMAISGMGSSYSAEGRAHDAQFMEDSAGLAERVNALLIDSPYTAQVSPAAGGRLSRIEIIHRIRRRDPEPWAAIPQMMLITQRALHTVAEEYLSNGLD